MRRKGSGFPRDTACAFCGLEVDVQAGERLPTQRSVEPLLESVIGRKEGSPHSKRSESSIDLPLSMWLRLFKDAQYSSS